VLGLRRWLVMGGSWGATLALAHALDAPDVVEGLLLRSPFLARAEDVQRFFTPRPGLETAWQWLAAVAGDVPLPTLHAALQGADAGAAARAAQAWWQWESALQGVTCQPEDLQGEALAYQTDRYRVQAHYLVHGCWLVGAPLPARCGALASLPTLLIQGREDRICPPDGAAVLHAALPGSRLQWVDEAGHDPGHPGLAAAVARALDGWADRQAWP
jgi:proline iminopeptidase